MEFRILGPLEVVDDGREVALGGPRPRALLAILLLRRGEVVPSETLIDELYGAQPPRGAAKSIQAHVSRLRKALAGGCNLRSAAGGYALDLDGASLDLDRFDDHVERGREAYARGENEIASEAFAAALDLWRGVPLADFRYADFAQGAIARLEERRLAVVEDKFEADLALGRHADVVSALEALVGNHPLRERPRGQLMLALYRSGRQAEALEAYAEARRVLTEELGLEPSGELKMLQRGILEHDPSLAAPSRVEGSRRAPVSDFVGRSEEMETLRAALNDAFGGRGRLVLVSGEPGIGKSRLAEELIAHARSRGARVLVGRCWEAGGAPAYWPWVQSLRTYIRECDAELLGRQLGPGASDLAQLLPELHDMYPDLPEPPALESEGARFRLFDAASQFLASASRAQPLVLVLDDLHAADEPSLLLLRFVTRELGRNRLLVVGAYRDVDPSLRDPLVGALADLVREPVTRRLTLDGLAEGDVGEYIVRTAGVEPETSTVAEIHGGTDGNPLFVGEIVRLLVAEGRLDDSDGGLRIPPGVREVIGSRVRRLPTPCQDVLVHASVLGREFALDLLAGVSSVEREHLLDMLDDAMAERVIAEVPGSAGRLRFAHVLIRDTLYDGLTSVRRVRLHRLAVDALEALYGVESGPHLAELAHHSVAGSDFEKGVDYAQRAGDEAYALLAYEEAARLFGTALEALELADPTNERRRCELLLALGASQARVGNAAIADTALLEAAGIARRLDLPRELARAASDYGGRMIWTRGSDVPGFLPLLEEALAGLADEEVELRARLLARLAGALRDEVSRERRDRLSRDAIEVARRTGNAAALVYALDGRAFAILAPDTLSECFALGTELRDLAEQIGDRESLVHGYMERVCVLVLVGDIAAVEADLDAARRIAEELRQPAQLWDVWGARAMLALAAGNLVEGEELVEQSLALGERALPAGVTGVYWVQRYLLCDFRGTVAEVESAIAALIHAHPTRPVFRCVLAHLHARLGRVPEASATLEALGHADFSAVPFDQEWLLSMSLLAETSGLLGDIDSASVLYDLLEPWSELNVADQAEGIRGAASRYLGILAATLSRWEDAERHFEHALEMNERMGARPWVALTERDYAAMLIARGASGDRERAEDLRRSARELADEIGMVLS